MKLLDKSVQTSQIKTYIDFYRYRTKFADKLNCDVSKKMWDNIKNNCSYDIAHHLQQSIRGGVFNNIDRIVDQLLETFKAK